MRTARRGQAAEKVLVLAPALVPARAPARVLEQEPAQVQEPGSATASSAYCCCRTRSRTPG